MIKTLLIVAGILSLFFGILGIFLPLLPTTPFLILSAFCFSKSSTKFYIWIMTHKVFGPPINHWKRDRSIRLKHKIFAIIVMVSSGIYIINKQSIPIEIRIGVVTFLIISGSFIAFQKTAKIKTN